MHALFSWHTLSSWQGETPAEDLPSLRSVCFFAFIPTFELGTHIGIEELEACFFLPVHAGNGIYTLPRAACRGYSLLFVGRFFRFYFIFELGKRTTDRRSTGNFLRWVFFRLSNSSP